MSRVAFVPIPIEEQHSSSFSSSTNVTVDSGTTNKVALVEPMSSDELRQSIASNLLSAHGQPSAAATANPVSILVTPAATRQQRDSFCDFFDTHRQRGTERMSTRLTMASRRDSFDWDVLQPKSVAADEPRQSICQTGFGLSPLNSANNSTAESLQRK